MLTPLKFRPLYQERVWGGRTLDSVFSRVLPAGALIGESWEIVDRPGSQSVIMGGPLEGATLRAAIEQEGDKIMGPQWERSRRFPILIKWLDCRERLSLQVHPPANIAPALSGEPKTENWYIARSVPGSSLIVGLKRGVTREQFEMALRNKSLEDGVHRFPISAGDSILVRSGQVHAIDEGNLILEIQQNSDTTYRVYDWGRVGLDGKPRDLHVKDSLRSIRWDDYEPTPVRAAAKSAVIANCAEFRIHRLPLASGERLSVPSNEQPRVLSVVVGSLRLSSSNENEWFAAGTNLLLPFCSSFSFEAATDATVLITDEFV